MKQKTSLLLMEQLVMILVFALAAALCLQIFAKADAISQETARRDRAVVLARNAAELLKATGGIVQGMSGSPILQNGKLVGAVTHVLVNDPTRGYGIFIENMLDAAS